MSRNSSAIRGLVLPIGIMVGAIGFGMYSYAQSGAPVLHQREAETGIQESPAATTEGTSTLPPEVSGEYLLGEDGGTIEIELQPDHLDGYVAVRGDRLSDKGTPLTYFFQSSRLNGVELGFSTYQVHGTWYSFKGTIVRGEAKSPSQRGFYVLKGMLTLHMANKLEQPRRVSMPMAAQSAN